MTHPLFDKIKAMIDAEDFSVTDLLRMPATFANSAPEVAHALLFHAIDYMDEREHAGDQEIGIADIISETYRRTFFDKEAAAKYGTEHIASNEGSVSTLVQMLTDNLLGGAPDLAPSPQAFFVPGHDTSPHN